MQNEGFATGPCFLSSESSGCRCRSAQSPPGHCGGASATPRRGDSVAKATDLFTIHSSLFTKKPSPFHIGLYFQKVPSVNPSVTPPACQLPLTREPLVQCRYRAGQGSNDTQKAAVRIDSGGTPPLWPGSLRTVPADNSARESSAIRYCPSKAR